MNRLEKIKDRLHNVEFLTKKEWWGEGLTILTNEAVRKEPLIIRKAKACEYVFANMPIEIKPDELVVGIARMSMIGFGQTFPEYALPEEIEEAAKINLSPLSVWGHQPPNYATMLTLGLSGIREQIEVRLQEELEKETVPQETVHLYRAMLISINGMSLLARRYALLCLQKAQEEPLPERRMELFALAKVCARVPEFPARTLQEALQCTWFTYISLGACMENVPMGRTDQYLYPYYRSDIDKGTITKELAEDLIGSFLAKFSERVQMNTEHWENHYDPTISSFGTDLSDPTLRLILDDDESYNYGVSANHWIVNMIIGGLRPDGNPGENDLTYMILDSWAFLEVVAPVMSVRLRPHTPEKLFRRVTEVLRCGSGEPAIYNEEFIINGLVALGIPVEEARDFSNDGCWESLVPGKTHYSYAHIEVLQLLEYVFQRGKSLIRGDREGLDTGDPAEFQTFEDFYAAFLHQMEERVERVVGNRLKFYGASYKIAPDPLVSIMIDGCIEKGLDISNGGARFTIFTPMITGLANCVDSLAAVKKLVYEERAVSISALIQAMQHNFDHAEPLRQMLINRAPKFGNDQAYVDELACRLLSDAERIVARISKNVPHVLMPLGIGTFESYAKFGHTVGASADGRLSQSAISSNFSPAIGAEKLGPTAAIKSICAPNLIRYASGCPLDMQINANEAMGESGIERLCGLIRAFFDLGGVILTITSTNEELLRDAQKHPEQHRSLRVRLGGLSAYFIALPPAMQEVLIRKTKFGL